MVAYGALVPRVGAGRAPRTAGSTCTSRCCPRGAARRRCRPPSCTATRSPAPRTFRLEEGLDTGPVYGVVTEPIRPRDTAGRPARPAVRGRRRAAGRHPRRDRGRHAGGAPAAGRRGVRGAEADRRGRPGRLGRAGAAGRPAGPGVHAGTRARGRRSAATGSSSARCCRSRTGRRCAPGELAVERRRVLVGTGTDAGRAGRGAGHRASGRCRPRTGPAARARPGERLGDLVPRPAGRRGRSPGPGRAPGRPSGLRPGRVRMTGRPAPARRGRPAAVAHARAGRPPAGRRPRPAGRLRPAPRRRRARRRTRTSRCPACSASAGCTGRDAAFATELGYGTLRGSRHPRRDPRPVRRPSAGRRRPGGARRAAAGGVPAAAHPGPAARRRLGDRRPGPSRAGAAGFVNAVLRRVARQDWEAWVTAVAPPAEADPLGHLAVRARAPGVGRRRLRTHALGGDLTETGGRAGRGRRPPADAPRRPAGPARPRTSWSRTPAASPGRGRRTRCGCPAAATRARWPRSGTAAPACRTRAASCARSRWPPPRWTAPDRALAGPVRRPRRQGGPARRARRGADPRRRGCSRSSWPPHRAALVAGAHRRPAGHRGPRRRHRARRSGPAPSTGSSSTRRAPASARCAAARRPAGAAGRPTSPSSPALQRALLRCRAGDRPSRRRGRATSSAPRTRPRPGDVLADVLADGTAEQLDARPLFAGVPDLGAGPVRPALAAPARHRRHVLRAAAPAADPRTGRAAAPAPVGCVPCRCRPR